MDAYAASAHIPLAVRPMDRSFEAMAYVVASMAGITPRTTLGLIKVARVHVAITRGSRRRLLGRTLFLDRLVRTEGLKVVFEDETEVGNRDLTLP